MPRQSICLSVCKFIHFHYKNVTIFKIQCKHGPFIYLTLCLINEAVTVYSSINVVYIQLSIRKLEKKKRKKKKKKNLSIIGIFSKELQVSSSCFLTVTSSNFSKISFLNVIVPYYHQSFPKSYR